MYKNIVVLNEYAFGLSEAPSVIVDAGANIGLTSIVFANRYPEAVIIAIEAERSNFDLLSKNVAPYANIHPVHAALWKSCTELSIVNEHANKCSFQVGKTKRGSDNKTQTVSAVTIDHVMTTFELDTIDLLKVDVEGAEIEIFGSCNSWIDRVSELIIELHDRHRTGCSESIEKLATDFPYKHTLGENIYLSRSGHFTFPNN